MMARRSTGTVNLYGRPAGFVTRAVAVVIDIALVVVVIAVFGIVVNLVFSFFGLESLLASDEPAQNNLQLVMQIAVRSSIAIITISFGPLYFMAAWAFIGQTLGMALIGIRVVTMDTQERISFKQTLVRYAGFIISAIPLFMGFFWVLFNDERRGWHDILSGTHVVYEWKARPDERFLKDLNQALLEEPTER